MYGKRVQLNCDIILNDEQFDENGNPIGGDGVVYSWSPNCPSSRGLCLYGNGFNIKGAYYNNIETSEISLFSERAFRVENVNFENSYFCAASVKFIAPLIDKIEKVNTHNGTIVGKEGVSAFTYDSNSLIGCNNFFNVRGGHYISGFISRINSLDRHTIFQNCNNYGNISSSGNSAYKTSNRSRCA